jgi:hypothetical protein
VGLGLAVLLAGMLVGPGAPARAAPVLTPHRAVYDLGLAKSRGQGGVAQARGKLEFEWADVCTGWTVTQRTRVKMVLPEGQVVDFGWSLNAFESRDGLHYRFLVRRFNAGHETDFLRGDARLERAGGRGRAVYSDPAPREVSLPKGTLFPSAHSLVLIEALERGDMPLWRVVFDGSSEEGLFGVNAALSRSLAANSELGFDSPLLRGQRSWRLRLAYFGMDETVAEPEHEQGLRLFENGIVDELLLDYGDFVLQGNLVQLEPLPDVPCKAK